MFLLEDVSFRQIGVQRKPLPTAQVTAAGSNQYTQVAYFGVACSATLQNLMLVSLLVQGHCVLTLRIEIGG